MNENALRRSADAGRAGEGFQLEIVFKFDAGKIEVDISGISDLCIDYKTNIDAKRVAGKVHSNKLKTKQGYNSMRIL